MPRKKDAPAAGDGRGRGNYSRWHAKSLTNNQASRLRQESIRAELVGSTVCTAVGLRVDTSSPVLAMCRRLIEAGYDPTTRLKAYRGGILCLVVRSIGEGAKLEINGQGAGFRPAREQDAASSVHSKEVEATRRRKCAARAISASGVS
jgi:hypothetical protein